MWMPGFSSCWYWNGGTLKTLVMPADLAQQRDGGVGRRHADGERIELGEVGLAPLLGGRHLQHHGLQRDLDGRHGDLVLLGEVGDAS